MLQLEFFDDQKCIATITADPAHVIPALGDRVDTWEKNGAPTPVSLEIVDRQLSTPTQSTMLLSVFALLALLLASLGLYGVLSYAVTQRTNEIGVRMALGATSSDILLSFGKRGLVLTLAGLAIGVVLAAIVSRPVRVTSTNSRMRFSSGPPYWSVRWFDSGERNS